MSKRQNSFPFIPAWLDDMELRPATFRVYAHLCRRGDNETRIAWPAIESIGKQCMLSRQTVSRILKELTEKGLILKLGKPFGETTRYRILIPNRLTRSTIEAPPIASSANTNRPTREHPIASPEAQEGSPRKVPQERRESVQSTPTHSLTVKINSVSPHWTGRELTTAETATVKKNAALFESLTPAHWKTFHDFYAARLPEGNAYFRPPTRSRFIQEISDICDHAQNWESKQPKPTPKRQPTAYAQHDQDTATPEDIAEFAKIQSPRHADPFARKAKPEAADLPKS